MRFTALVLFFLLTVCSGALQAQQVPENSLNALQDMFADVRDGLWQVNDEFWHRGEYERCIAMMKLLTQIDPQDIEAYDGGAWLMENQLRDEEAEAFLRLGLANNPRIYDMHFALGYFCYLRLRFDEAVRHMETAVALGAPAFVWSQLAHAMEHAGLVSDAFSIWMQLDYQEPESIAANQMERIMRGEPPTQTPQMISKSRAERKAEATRNE